MSEIKIHAGDAGRSVGADFFARLGAAEQLQAGSASVSVVRVDTTREGRSRVDVTSEFFDPLTDAEVVTRSVVSPAETERPDDLLGVTRELRDPVGGRADAEYEILFSATVNVLGDPVENVAGRLIVDQTGRVSSA